MLEFSRKTQPTILIDVDDTAIDDIDPRGNILLQLQSQKSHSLPSASWRLVVWFSPNLKAWEPGVRLSPSLKA